MPHQHHPLRAHPAQKRARAQHIEHALLELPRHAVVDAQRRNALRRQLARQPLIDAPPRPNHLMLAAHRPRAEDDRPRPPLAHIQQRRNLPPRSPQPQLQPRLILFPCLNRARPRLHLRNPQAEIIVGRTGLRCVRQVAHTAHNSRRRPTVLPYPRPPALSPRSERGYVGRCSAGDEGSVNRP